MRSKCQKRNLQFRKKRVRGRHGPETGGPMCLENSKVNEVVVWIIQFEREVDLGIGDRNQESCLHMSSLRPITYILATLQVTPGSRKGPGLTN